MIKIIPVEDRLLVELEDETKDMGLSLPEGVKREEYRIGKVLAVGPLVHENAGKVGQRVLFERYGPLHLKQFNEKWFLVRQQYILGIIEE